MIQKQHDDGSSPGRSVPASPASPLLPLPFSPIPRKSLIETRTTQFCFSRLGLALQIIFNAIFIVLNAFLIIFELIISSPESANTELWFIVLDISLVCALVVEVLLRQLEFGCNFPRYCAKTENKVDMLVVVLSVGCLSFYIWDFEHANNASTPQYIMVSLRIVRDVVRTIRVIFFIKSLYNTIVDFRHLGEDTSNYFSLHSDESTGDDVTA